LLGASAVISAESVFGVFDVVLLAVALDGLDPRLPAPALPRIAGPLPQLLPDVAGRIKAGSGDRQLAALGENLAGDCVLPRRRVRQRPVAFGFVETPFENFATRGLSLKGIGQLLPALASSAFFDGLSPSDCDLILALRYPDVRTLLNVALLTFPWVK